MAATSSTATGSVVVVTHVGRTVPAVLPPLSPTPGTTSLSPVDDNTFNRGRPVVIGTIQIITGLIILVCGCIMATHSNTLQATTGVFVWAPVMFTIAGSVTVAAGTSLSTSLIKSAVGFNVVAAVTAVLATTIYFLNFPGILKKNDPLPPSWIQDQDEIVDGAFAGILAVLSFLEFGLAVSVAGGSCRCSYVSGTELFSITNTLHGATSVTVVTSPSATASLTAPAATGPPPPYEKPPEYSSIIN